MKRFLMYVVVIIGVLAIGLTTYYFAKNNETIGLTIEEGSTIYLNKTEDGYIFPLYHDKKNRDTTVEISSSDETIAKYDESANTIVAVEGGSVQFTITTSNKNFGPFKFNVWVGNGTVDNPYFIRNAQELKKIGVAAEVGAESWELSQCYRVVEPIDMSELGNAETGEVGNWTPIGKSQTSPFEGQFNGQNLVISNLSIIQGPGQSLQTSVGGLFGYVSSSAKIFNVTIDSATLDGDFTSVGAIAGVLSGKINNSIVTNTHITSSKTTGVVGGIAGTLERSSGWPRVEMCVSNATLSSMGGTVGGIVGVLNSGVVVNSRSNATMVGIEVDSLETPVDGEEPVKTTTIVYPNISGGIVGVMNVKTIDTVVRGSVIKKCLGVISIDPTFEKITTKFGTVVGAISDEKSSGGIYLCKVDSVYVKQIASETAPVYNNFGEIADEMENELLTHVTTLTSTNQYKRETYVAKISSPIVYWNFDEVWENVEDQTIPTIKLDGAGEALNEWEDTVSLSNASDALVVLEQLRDNEGDARSKTYVITSDITVDLAGKIWKPIGTKTAPFTGVFATLEDNAHVLTIKNVTIDKANLSEEEKLNIGLFGYTKGAEISAIALDNVNYNGLESSSVMGSVVAYMENSFLTGVVTKAGVLKNASTVGGIVGVVDQTSMVSGCWMIDGIVKQEVEGQIQDTTIVPEINTLLGSAIKQIGGVAGIVNGTLVDSLIRYAKITAGGRSCDVGGIVGKVGEGASVRNSYYSDGSGIVVGNNTTSTINVGGIAGNSNGIIEKCYSKSCMIETPQSSNSFVGGIAGDTGNAGLIKYCAVSDASLKGYYIGGLVAIVNCEISECYVTASLSGIEIGGFAWNTNKSISNCYNICSLEGKSSGSKSAGFSVKLPSPGKIEKCFSGASFMGLGEKRAESFTNVRSYFADWFEEAGKPGEIIFAGFNGASIETSTGNEKADVVFDTIGAKKWSKPQYAVYKIAVSNNVLSENEINTLVNTMKFDSSTIWLLEAGHFLELRTCDFDEIKVGDTVILAALKQYVVEEVLE